MRKESQRLLSNFTSAATSAAMDHGWQNDQGPESSAEKARQRFKRHEKALIAHIESLEAKAFPEPAPQAEYHPNWETAGGTTPEQNEARFA